MQGARHRARRIMQWGKGLGPRITAGALGEGGPEIFTRNYL